MAKKKVNLASTLRRSRPGEGVRVARDGVSRCDRPIARGHLTTSAERTCDSMRFTATLRRFIAPSKHKMPPLSRDERTNACTRLSPPVPPTTHFGLSGREAPCGRLDATGLCEFDQMAF